MNKQLKFRFILYGIPAFAGFAVFYIYPFFRTLYYSMINNTFQRNFVWFDNYIAVFNNQFFRLAMRNTLIFSFVGVLVLMLISLLLSYALFTYARHLEFVKNMLLAPLIVPTASIIFVWQLAFPHSGTWPAVPIYLLYFWKYTGLTIIILGAAIVGIDNSITEAAKMDGAGSMKIFKRITLPLITPSLSFVVVLSFANSLRIFRESFLFFGTSWPPDAAYTVQFWMNNNFQRLNYPALASGSVLFALIVTVVLLVIYIWENKYSEKIF